MNNFNKDELVKVSTYAAERGISVSMVYKLIHQKKIDLVEIDGVKFIKRGREGDSVNS